MSDDLDRERINALLLKFSEAVKAHYLAADSPRQILVYEALNALAATCALVICGAAQAGGLEDCMQFFTLALQNQVNSTLDALYERDKGAPTGLH